MSTALVLAGHGSHISPHTAGLVWGYVDRLRALGVADEVTACFWKEQPSFREVMGTLASERVIVVPVFTAQGYFSQTVIPSEMGLTSEKTQINGRTVHYTRTLGEHPHLAAIVRSRVQDTLKKFSLEAASVAVAVIGHGTPRSRASRDAARHQADVLRQSGIVREVVDVYLDDTPDIPSVYDTTTAPDLIAVPFFLAPGSHVMQDVPQALGIDPAHVPQTVRNRRVYYTEPVGTDDAIVQLILELARDAGLQGGMSPVAEHAWSGFPVYGRDVLWDAVQRDGRLTFGELELTPDTVKPLDTNAPSYQLNSPADLRDMVRNEPFRPLATATGLPGGWRVEIDCADALHGAVETIYPAAVAQWAQQQRGNFQPETLQDAIDRQQGMFRTLADVSNDEIEGAIDAVCGGCVRHPSWYDRNNDDSLPCLTPCNYWLSAVKEGRDT